MSCRVPMTDSSFSRGPTIRARAIRSGLSTQGTSKTSEDEFNGLVDVRLAASRDSSRLLAGHGEHLVAFGCDILAAAEAVIAPERATRFRARATTAAGAARRSPPPVNARSRSAASLVVRF